MKDSIRLSSKHGVNPTMGRCFWCGETDGTIGLLGRLPGDRKAPFTAVLSYDPCPTCKAEFARGIALFVVTSECPREGAPPIASDAGREAWPTGAVYVIREEAVDRIFDPETAVNLKRARRGFLEESVATMLGFGPHVADDTTKGSAE